MKLCALTKMTPTRRGSSPAGTTPTPGVRLLSLALADIQAPLSSLLEGRGSRYSACIFLYGEENSSGFIHPTIEEDKSSGIISTGLARQQPALLHRFGQDFTTTSLVQVASSWILGNILL